MFATLHVPFDAYRDLPEDCRWLVQCLARYADRQGKCWPTMRQLVGDVRRSLSTVCRRLKKLAEMGVFHRTRQGVGRYVYTLAEPYRLGWPKRVSAPQDRVSHVGTQEALPSKDKGKGRFEGLVGESPWTQRLASWRRSGFWLVGQWGPAPNEPGCWVPAQCFTAKVSRETLTR